jgi:hypothetical protein
MDKCCPMPASTTMQQLYRAPCSENGNEWIADDNQHSSSMFHLTEHGRRRCSRALPLARSSLERQTWRRATRAVATATATALEGPIEQPGAALQCGALPGDLHSPAPLSLCSCGPCLGWQQQPADGDLPSSKGRVAVQICPSMARAAMVPLRPLPLSASRSNRCVDAKPGVPARALVRGNCADDVLVVGSGRMQWVHTVGDAAEDAVGIQRWWASLVTIRRVDARVTRHGLAGGLAACHQAAANLSLQPQGAPRACTARGNRLS